eukprot:jgi/Orpsp1_1/1190897/evm.model.d7180000081936.1
MKFNQEILTILSLVAVANAAAIKNSDDGCWSEKYGYKCCDENNCDVYSTDRYGSWGIQGAEWCGIRPSCNINLDEYCWSSFLGYPCCPEKYNKKVQYEDDQGKWGYDYQKQQWCGITDETNTPKQEEPNNNSSPDQTQTETQTETQSETQTQTEETSLVDKDRLDTSGLNSQHRLYVERCKSELAKYNVCQFETKDISAEELASKCTTYAEAKCDEFYLAPNAHAGNCALVSQYVPTVQFGLLKRTSEKRTGYHDLCEKATTSTPEQPTEQVSLVDKDRVDTSALNRQHKLYVERCQSELAKYKVCQFETNNVSDEQLASNCSAYATAKCDEFYLAPNAHASNCALVSQYVPTVQFGLLKRTAEKRTGYQGICEKFATPEPQPEQPTEQVSLVDKDRVDTSALNRQHKLYVERCQSELAKYKVCQFETNNVSDEQLASNCSAYATAKCDEFYLAPNAHANNCALVSQYVPTVQFGLLKRTAEKRAGYQGICEKFATPEPQQEQPTEQPTEKVSLVDKDRVDTSALNRQHKLYVERCQSELAKYKVCQFETNNVSDEQLASNCSTYATAK